MKTHPCLSVIEWSFILLFLALAPFISLAQTTNGTSLPPDALDAFNKGVIAAKQTQNYPLAIRYFQDARKLAPGVPMIYLNLGLAESKIPGRELRAIAWFAAYLASNPNASNASAVKEQIDILDVRSQNNLSRLIKTAQDTATQTGDDKDYNLFDLARLLALSGDVTSALKTINLLQNGHNKDLVCMFIIDAQTKSGDIAGALKTVDLFQDLHNKGDALYGVATTQAEMGDIATALKTADLIQDAEDKSFAQETIAETQIKKDDISGAQETLASAQKTSDLIQDAAAKSEKQHFIAETQTKIDKIRSSQIGVNQLSTVEAKIKAGDIGAALKASDLIGYDSAKYFALLFIAGAQTRDGDFTGAQKTIDLIQSSKDVVLNFCAMIRSEEDKTKSSEYYSQTVMGYYGLEQADVVYEQLGAGDILGAQKTAAMIQDSYAQSRAQEAIANAQLAANDIAGALKTADLDQDAKGKSWLQNSIAKAQIKADDIAGAQKTWADAQKTANLIEDAYWKTSAQNDISKDQAQAATQPIASDWLDKLEDGNEGDACALNTDLFLDLASYLTAQHSDDPKKLFSALKDTAEKIIKAQNVIDKKLKQQAKQQTKP